MNKVIIFLAVFALCAASVSAQSNAANVFTVSGQVVDSVSNDPVPYATVSVATTEAPTQYINAVACDGDGKFAVPIKAAGNYVMTVQSVGTEPLIKPFTLTDASRKVDFGKLTVREKAETIGEVTVSAQRPLVKVEIDKLIYNMEEDPEAKVNNTLDMLRKVPMVTVDGEDNVQLKGSTNFKVYLNGKESNLLSGQNMSDVLKSMPANTIKNIEVITDPGVRYDAEGIGGIINIVTTRNAFQGLQGSVQANAGTFGSYGGGAYLTAKLGKLGLTGNFNYNNMRRPGGEMSGENVAFSNNDYHTEKTFGESENSGRFMFGHLEASYEFDTLRLLSLGVDLWNGHNNSNSDRMVEMLNIDNVQQYSYKTDTETEYHFGQTGVNLDYQRSTRKKGENYTFSYRFNQSPNDNITNTTPQNIVGIIPDHLIDRLEQQYNNDAKTTEHTAQLDYVNPLTEKHTIEAGLKYILRQNTSNVQQLVWDGEIWEPVLSGNRDFKHLSNIYAAYAGYAFKTPKWGFRTGLRAEGTKQNVEYPKADSLNFGVDYPTVVPSVTVSYQLKPTQQIRLGYNLRIYRPGIWYLNPYINDTDPLHISYGNPNLDPENSHAFNLNYSYFTPKITLNISGSYSYINNAIQSYEFILPEKPDVMQRTYANIGRNQRTGIYINAGWTPNKVLRLNLNGGINYVDMKSESTELTAAASGFNENVYGTAQISLPKDIRINLTGMYNSGWINLQGDQKGYAITQMSASKDFFKKKLTLSLSCTSPIKRAIEFEGITTTADFQNIWHQNLPMREGRIIISYRFGSMKESIKKVQRGITNDDVKGGGGGGEGGGASSGMGSGT